MSLLRGSAAAVAEVANRLHRGYGLPMREAMGIESAP
jgi:hypothetical protein